MRTITEHQVNPANTVLRITVTDEPGSGGASHRYEVTGLCTETNASAIRSDPSDSHTILFQNGPVGLYGVNGLTHEVLLAIVADRLRSFQAGPYACKDNLMALNHIEHAQNWLQRRTHERIERGVEGTHIV